MTTLQRYGRPEIERFLRHLDASLNAVAEVIVIGWAAAILRYDAPGQTIDIDTWTNVTALRRAASKAAEKSGLSIPFGSAGVADAPIEFEHRLARVLPRLRRLKLLAPEKHDLALMKTVRGLEHDMDALAALHQLSPLDCDTLVARFRGEMGHAIGDPARLRDNFLALIERLFPDRVDGVAKSLAPPVE